MNTLESISEKEQGCVLAVGNFDGVHKGHQALLAQGRALAQEKGVPLTVLTFEPHPRRIFYPDDPPFRITPEGIKKDLLERYGVDVLISLPFDWTFASQSAEAFVERVFTYALKPAHILIGEDFRFGQLRKGSASTIRDAGFSVSSFLNVADEEGVRFSSTSIRELLRQGDMERAQAALGRTWSVRGDVVRGDRRGHTIGYPTANVMLGDTIHPAYGVYATWVRIEGETVWRMAATNIGIRPMFEVPVGQVEAHILDFEDRDIYGRSIDVALVSRLRGEAKFSSLPDLIHQIAEDCLETRAFLATHPMEE